MRRAKRAAQCLKQIGREAEALALLQQAAAIPQAKFLEAQRQLGESVEYDSLHLELGIVEAALGHTDAAVAALEKAVTYNSKHRQARYQFAQALNAAGRSEEAKTHFEWYSEIEKKSTSVIVSTTSWNASLRILMLAAA
ncbi:MAG: tetratricopeptide repeat protein [Planctomycetia bacterium]|nr:tetratricopeptide repeat protein [Planctomycetia bacterium]